MRMPEAPQPPLLRVTDLSVGFRTGREVAPVTDRVSFEVRRGQTVALVGESGSGKSVTAMSMVDLLPSNAVRTGSIVFENEQLLDASSKRMRELRGARMGVVFQEPMTALNPVYTIGDLLRQSITAHDRTMSPAGTTKRALELLELVEMPEPRKRLGRYAHELSGGQRQRAMIAMAVAHNPRLLIADEPTTALDVTAQAVILDLMLELQSTLGMAMLIITHDMGVVADTASRVVVMNQGSVVEDADVDDLFYSPTADYTSKLLAAVPRLLSTAPPPGSSHGSKDTTTGPNAADSAAVAEAGSPVLDVRELGVVFPSRLGQTPFTALDDVSLTVDQGEVVGLVGESGSGKSTLGRVVVGLTKPTSGHVRVADIDVSRPGRAERRELRRRAAIIFQDPASSLNPRETIAECIGAPLRWNHLEPRARARRAIVEELLDSVHLPRTFADRYPHELSGGQRQRVGIARAMAVQPDLLIADEPTSALDVSVQATVLALLEELLDRRKFSCLFISHDLSVIEQIAHRVVVLRSGRVVEQGSAFDILNHPKDPYTQRLVAAVPVPDPHEQRRRRTARLALTP
jgi:peptide/nickel transport system ATP-binding protein